ncbi:MAG: hypothetical protein LBG59_09860 [Candidatus Peribacteria bacterium]|nr:hypothetical protein [Candidatus Peribacteria bacterium]
MAIPKSSSCSSKSRHYSLRCCPDARSPQRNGIQLFVSGDAYGVIIKVMLTGLIRPTLGSSSQ